MRDDARTKRIAEQLTSIFENGTTAIQYDYAEFLDDGRGITCGRSGFCTGTGDAFEVVKRYCEIKPANALANYLTELGRLNSAENSSDTSGLDGYIRAWQECSRDNDFRRIQDDVTDDFYWRPSQHHADKLGLKTPLSRAFIFDTLIQHGDSDDADGLGQLLYRTNINSHGTPSMGIDEQRWLSTFIAVRRADLAHCHNESSRQEWAGSVGRCDAFSQIAETGNYDLITPFEVKWEGESHTIV